MAKTKGIRVNQLAKELGVPSKKILDKIKDEGLGEQAPNHMSLISLGLAESVRGWFAAAGSGGVATAVEEATEAATGAGAHAADEGSAEGGAAEGTTAAPAKRTTRRRTTKKADSGAQEAAAQERDDVAKAASAAAGGSATAAVAEAAGAATGEAGAPAAGAPTEQPAPGVAPAAEAPGVAPAAGAPTAPVESPAALPAAEAGGTPPSTTQPATESSPATLAPAAAASGASAAAAATPASGQPMSVATPPPASPTLRVSTTAAPAGTPAAPPTTGPGARPAAATGPGTRPGGGGFGPEQGRVITRPTVSINDRLGTQNRGGIAGDRGKPAVPVVVPFTPKPAQIQGPRVVRTEAPDVVAVPRRRPLPGQGGPSPAFMQARPQTGRGVRGPGTGDDEAVSEEAGKKPTKGKTLSNRRRGLDGRRGEADANAKLREFTEADLIERAERLRHATSDRADRDNRLKKTSGRGTAAQVGRGAQRSSIVEVQAPVTVKALAAALGVKAGELIFKLMQRKVMANLNTTLADDDARLLAADMGVELEVKADATLEEQLVAEFKAVQVPAEALRPRPPVVTILGHVDHGKTSLLDKIRHANVAAGEAGGITQHTAAWMVQVGEGETAKRVTFIDTPGHQAFTSMRARGANMTDIVVLVVSAAEGVQPQTIESINHARAAEVPIVVALNKIDRPDANPDMVLGQLAKEGLNPVEWGGDTEVVRTSAVTGQGIEDLIEILHYRAELLELKANPTGAARGTVIEARRDEGLGPVATVLVQDGTLKVGDIMLCGPGYGRVRILINDRGEHVQEAGPSTPVVVSGLSEVPAAGDAFYVLDDLDRARAIAEERAMLARQGQLTELRKATLGSGVLEQLRQEDVKVINIILKGDVQGSVETLAKTVTDHNTEEVKVRVIHSGVGPITESDVQLAMATKAKPQDNKVVIIGFHVAPDDAARALAEHHHIEIRLYQVIYEIFDDLKKALSGMLAPEVREKHHGRAEIRKVFKVSKVGSVAGCFVTEGHIQRGSKIRLIRGGAVVTEDLSLESLKRLKDDVREVKAGFECGLKIAGYDDIKEGDILDAYVRETFERTL